MFAIAAAFQTLTGFAFVGDVTIKTCAQKRLKTRFACIVVREVVLLKRVREEALCQILRVFVIRLPLEPHVFVNGFPVTDENRFERALSYNLIGAARDRKSVV